MPNYAPVLPLALDKVDGYKMNKNIKDVIKQNFKMLLLTGPGERIMIPEFGVGIKRFLFEPLVPTQFAKIKSRIESQVDTYMPFLSIVDVSFRTADSDPTVGLNTLGISVKYAVPSINLVDELDLKLESEQF